MTAATLAFLLICSHCQINLPEHHLGHSAMEKKPCRHEFTKLVCTCLYFVTSPLSFLSFQKKGDHSFHLRRVPLFQFLISAAHLLLPHHDDCGPLIMPSSSVFLMPFSLLSSFAQPCRHNQIFPIPTKFLPQVSTHLKLLPLFYCSITNPQKNNLTIF